MAIEKHKDCKYYNKIDDETGNCIKHPPFLHRDKTDRYPVVNKNEKACGEFVAEE